MKSKNNFILRAQNITKYFGGVCALNNVNLDLKKGEILGLVGDNGAGKSTLIKIISGALKKDSGEIFLEGSKVEIDQPSDAKGLGIETIYQDLALINVLDIPVNIFLGREVRYKNIFGKYFGFLNFKEMNSESQKLVDRFDLGISNIHRSILFYSGGQRQAVAFSKAVYWSKKIVILDEPIAALGVKESKKALKLIRSMNDHGLSIIIISHNFEHVFNVVDRIMILRRGNNVGVLKASEVSSKDIVSLITGAGEVNNN